jgi:hypothetical protein
MNMWVRFAIMEASDLVTALLLQTDLNDQQKAAIAAFAQAGKVLLNTFGYKSSI